MILILHLLNAQTGISMKQKETAVLFVHVSLAITNAGFEFLARHFRGATFVFTVGQSHISFPRVLMLIQSNCLLGLTKYLVY